VTIEKGLRAGSRLSAGRPGEGKSEEEHARTERRHCEVG
jgi:hypothetical protein